MREFKFRVYDKEKKRMLVNGICVGIGINGQYILDADDRNWEGDISWIYEKNITNNLSLDNFEIMQYTGLKDKNGSGLTKVYEGDIISIDGTLKGNIYEDNKEPTDIVIPQLGTKAWANAYKEAMGRGYNYSE